MCVWWLWTWLIIGIFSYIFPLPQKNRYRYIKIKIVVCSSTWVLPCEKKSSIALYCSVGNVICTLISASSKIRFWYPKKYIRYANICIIYLHLNVFEKSCFWHFLHTIVLYTKAYIWVSTGDLNLNSCSTTISHTFKKGTNRLVVPLKIPLINLFYFCLKLPLNHQEMQTEIVPFSKLSLLGTLLRMFD